ncbi:sn1-specific diacylglycerol lipase beta-like, partial [Sinocyclocheilus grahami]|uniref:sn1-specific diacylglycerol lipase beta-like n=1 Tax=Sinocyclocheilus grahami TaxID=75366 RepID=UPI0007ACFFAE
MEDLKRRLLKMVSNCSKPKYKILMHGCWYELFGGTPDDFPTELENRREEALSQPLLGEESLLVQRSNTYQSLSSDDSPSHPTHLPLYPPGRILHITEDGPARRSAHTPGMRDLIRLKGIVHIKITILSLITHPH